jgi:hypothetical protein
MDDVGNELLSPQEICVAGVLVVGADGLDEADSR